MFCIKCGKEIKDGTKFCTNCGAEVTAQKEKVKETKEKEDKLSYSQNQTIKTTTNPTPTTTQSTSTGEQDGKATASLVLGICSFVVFCLMFPLSIIGLILGLVSKEKSGKRTAGIILNSIALGLSVVISILSFTTGFIEGFTEAYNNAQTNKPVIINNNTNNNTKKSTKVNGDKFSFDKFEIAIGNNYSFVQVNNEYSQYNGQDVIKLPITLKNTSYEKTHLNMFYHSYEGPSGKSLPKLAAMFDESIDYADDLESGEEYTKYLYILYDGDGKYKIEFNNYKEKKTVEFTINK